MDRISFSAFAQDATVTMRGGAPERTISITFSAHSDCVKSWVDFFKEVQKRAAGGHSFSLEADRVEGGSNDYPRTGIDGDGADKIVRIQLNGKDV